LNCLELDPDDPINAGKVSRQYIDGLCDRTKELVVTSPIHLDLPRFAASCQDVISPWFSLLEDLMNKFHYPPALLFSTDETSNQLHEASTDIAISSVDTPTPPLSPGPPKMPNSTFLLTIPALGNALPTVLLWPSKTVPVELLPLRSFDVHIIANTSGWMEKDIFEEIMIHLLLPAINERRKVLKLDGQRALLLLDSHVSRLVPSIWAAAAFLEIDLLTYPAHTTHLIAPLDCGVNGAFKTAMKALFEAPPIPGIKILREEIVRILPPSLHLALSPKVMQAGFRKTGIYPLSPSAVLNKIPVHSPISSSPSSKDSPTKLQRISGKLLTDSSFFLPWLA
jgi:hypothetical protein